MAKRSLCVSAKITKYMQVQRVKKGVAEIIFHTYEL